MEPYHISQTVHEEFSAAVARVRETLAEHGFGIVSQIDLAAVLREKLGIEHDPYVILGACNPGFAKRAVDSEQAVGVLLPCNVVVRAIDSDAVVVDFMDPAVLVGLVGKQRVHELAEEVRTRLEMARDILATTPTAA